MQAQVARAVAESYVAQVNAERLSVGTALAAGAPTEDVPELATQAALLRLPESVDPSGPSDDPLKAISYFAPSMGIFFVLSPSASEPAATSRSRKRARWRRCASPWR
ncbi:hypothetical protein ACFYO0_40725 [Streptomyces sp. NPDC006365]|uniref:hypothetical protein n=1 Tax=Streptomyces sp. NPDC006365 TaxID=3364744 RepID=UPI00367896B2